MISNSALTAAQKRDISHRMDSYDAHMNQYGHYSMKKVRAIARSPILDSLVAQGVTLASDYASRFPKVDIVNTATPIVNKVDTVNSEPLVNTTVNKPHQELTPLPPRDDPSYMKVYMANKRIATRR